MGVIRESNCPLCVRPEKETKTDRQTDRMVSCWLVDWWDTTCLAASVFIYFYFILRWEAMEVVNFFMSLESSNYKVLSVTIFFFFFKELVCLVVLRLQWSQKERSCPRLGFVPSGQSVLPRVPCQAAAHCVFWQICPDVCLPYSSIMWNISTLSPSPWPWPSGIFVHSPLFGFS